MKKLFSLVICVMALIFSGCEQNAPATSNKVKTGIASNITSESVVLHGVMNVDISQYDDVEFGMMVSETKAELNDHKGDKYEAKVLIGRDFEIILEGLSPATKYYYCAWVFLNDTQYEFGSIQSFITLDTLTDWKLQNEFWLQENAKKEGVAITPTGLQYRCIQEGSLGGKRPNDDSLVAIAYEGMLINGHVFDTAESCMGYVNSFIDGFAEGIKIMHPQSIYEFYIPYTLAYGDEKVGIEGTTSYIPPYSTLIFRVHLLSVN